MSNNFSNHFLNALREIVFNSNNFKIPFRKNNTLLICLTSLGKKYLSSNSTMYQEPLTNKVSKFKAKGRMKVDSTPEVLL